MAGIGAQKDESRKGGQVNPEGWVLAMAGFSCESDLFPGAGTLGLWHECLDKHFSHDGDLSLPLGLALGSPIFPSGCEGNLGVALESLQGRRDLT